MEPPRNSLPQTLADANMLVIGLGLMGGSLALSLKSHCRSIVGFDPHPAVCRAAEEMGCVDRASQEIGDVLSEANLIVLAAPVLANLEWLDYLASSVSQPTVIVDLSSTKINISKRMTRLPDHVYPIGGHPMCGKAVAGIHHASSELYQNAVFALVKPRPSSQLAEPVILDLVSALKAVPLWMEADAHDAWVAFTSHLPYLVANALAFVTPDQAFPLIGPGFRSTTRLATSSLPMIQDILYTNRQSILRAVTGFQEHLYSLQNLLEAEDYSQLTELLQAGAERQQDLFNNQLSFTQRQA